MLELEVDLVHHPTRHVIDGLAVRQRQRRREGHHLLLEDPQRQTGDDCFGSVVPAALGTHHSHFPRVIDADYLLIEDSSLFAFLVDGLHDILVASRRDQVGGSAVVGELLEGEVLEVGGLEEGVELH